MMNRLPETRRSGGTSAFDELFEDFLDTFNRSLMSRAAGLGTGSEQGLMVPQADIDETDDAYLLSVEIPGVPKENIQVNLDENVLTISAQKQSRSDEKSEEGLQRVEQSSMRYMRSFRLPSSVDTEGIEASCDHGVLEIKLPKSHKSQSRSIEIGAGAKSEGKIESKSKSQGKDVGKMKDKKTGKAESRSQRH
jgi:HSP20 family protein